MRTRPGAHWAPSITQVRAPLSPAPPGPSPKQLVAVEDTQGWGVESQAGSTGRRSALKRPRACLKGGGVNAAAGASGMCQSGHRGLWHGGGPPSSAHAHVSKGGGVNAAAGAGGMCQSGHGGQ